MGASPFGEFEMLRFFTGGGGGIEGGVEEIGFFALTLLH